MEHIIVQKLFKSFEDIKKTEGGMEWWSARDLAPLLGYSDWRNFFGILDKAKESCKGSGRLINNHFVDTNKMIDLAK